MPTKTHRFPSQKRVKENWQAFSVGWLAGTSSPLLQYRHWGPVLFAAGMSAGGLECIIKSWAKAIRVLCFFMATGSVVLPVPYCWVGERFPKEKKKEKWKIISCIARTHTITRTHTHSRNRGTSMDWHNAKRVGGFSVESGRRLQSNTFPFFPLALSLFKS